MLLRRAAASCIAGAALLALAPTAGATPPPNVVLITVDTLRADRLGCYGAPRATPRIDRLAAEGCLFEHAVSPMPVTRPAHFSMFTARHPRQHGVLHNDVALPASFPVLSEAFDAAGYDTAAFVAVKLLDRSSGAARGFDVFSAPAAQSEDAPAVVSRAAAWLRARPPSAPPFFLWLHLFDPHTPYAPAAAFAPAASPALTAALPEASWQLLDRRAAEHGGDLPLPLFERAVALYEAEVAQVDHWVGVLLDALAAGGTLDGTVVALTADHGECFERGIFFNHTNCLYEGAVRVPLIVRYPRAVAGGQRRMAQARLIDLPRTLLHLAGLPAGPFGGVALLDPAAEPAPYAVVEYPRLTAKQRSRRAERTRHMRTVAGAPVRWPSMDGDHYALRTPEWKYVASDHREQLFDLSRDPTETDDRAAAEPARLAALRRQLREWLRAHPRPTPAGVEMDDALRETLRALGYSD